MRKQDTAAITAAIVCALWWATAAAQPTGEFAPSRFRQALDKIEERLERGGYEGRWKALRRDAVRLADEIVGRAWHSRDLGPVLGALSLYRGAAEANLGERDTALWYWHVALNLDRRVAAKDLSRLGTAERLFREFPLRHVGEAPAGFEILRTPYPRSFEPPEEPEIDTTPIIESIGLDRERPRSLHLEVVIDREGRLHHPVVTSPDAHPITIYVALDFLYRYKRLRPARAEGEPRAVLLPMNLDFTFSRW